MDLRRKTCLTVVAVLALSLPIWARTDSAQLVVDHPVTIGAQQLEPGTYNLKANDAENQISVVRADDGKTIASIPCEWVQLAQKPRQTEVLFNADRVIEIDFSWPDQGRRDFANSRQARKWPEADCTSASFYFLAVLLQISPPTNPKMSHTTTHYSVASKPNAPRPGKSPTSKARPAPAAP